MAAEVGLRQRIHDRLYGDVVQRWRSGTLDDRQFGRAYRLRAQKYVPLAFVLPFVLASIGDWLERDISLSQHLERVANFALIFGIFWLPIAAVIDRNARWGVRDMLLRRGRDAAERQQQRAVAQPQATGTSGLVLGSYRRTTRYWNRRLLQVAAYNALVALLSTVISRAQLFLVISLPLLLWTLLARFDRRPYLEITAEGIWYRAWGKQRLPFQDFKAAYTRQDRLGEKGVVLIPKDPANLTRKLSLEGRLSMRSGENVPAHAGTLTIWTSKVGLDQDLLLRGLQAKLAKGPA
jgi:hypothetical protein